MPRKIAVIDIGSTAIKVLAADADRDAEPAFSWGIVEPPWGWQTARLCGLAAGRGDDARGPIDEASARAAAEIVRDYAGELRARGFGDAKVVAIATGAVRDAPNRDEVLAQIERASGVRARVLDAAEEARLSVYGSVRALGIRGARVLGIDQGGGSTEIAVARVDDAGAVSLVAFESLPIGAARLERAIEGLPLASAYDALRAQMSRAVARRTSPGPLVAIATGTALARVRARGTRALHGRTFTVRELDVAVRELAANPASARARTAVAGVPLVLAILEAFGCAEVTYSAAGLRYGVFFALARGDAVAGVRAW